MWYAFGGGLAKFPGSGVVLKSNCVVLDCGFKEFLYRGLSLFFKAQRLPQIEDWGGGGGGEGGAVVFSWMSCWCKETELSSGIHLG